ncbi:signal peptidase II [Conexibacter sp. CPCC 206217]|uniref:signal peptidase II n=1 Tax=Conexibacter sp. CPCC 206217 TaxID=3064574 RepID=UPI00271B7326|nr:signal peptidase II [Conexibacter sp. CPCC 206217]MDO8210423.1 signal peptidase II [Conexibacter sp. CPCC 206217]
MGGGRTAGASWLRVALVAAVVLVLDQLTKALVRADVAVGEKNEVLPFLDIGHVHNDGVAFGFLGGGGAIVLIVTFAALALLIGFFARNPGRPLLWLPTGMLIGGAIGNLIDRIRQGYVTDFIELPHWPSFNVADISITCGVLVLVFVLERNARPAAA